MRRPVLLLPEEDAAFPDPREFDDDGLVAVGGDLSTTRLLRAYGSGVFPWFNEGYPPLWWSPNPRAVLPLDSLHVSRSMRRRLRQADYKVTWNQAFSRVVALCADRAEGTWLVPDMQRAYAQLHQAGLAHSVEVWIDKELVGGLYGVGLGGLFAAESMFHRTTNASKIALLYAAASLGAAGVKLFDVQFLTPHLASLGAHEISRDAYLRRLLTCKNLNLPLFDIDLLPPV